MPYYVFSETPYSGAPMLTIGDGLRNLLHAKPFSASASVEVLVDEDQLSKVDVLDWRDYLIAPQPIISKRLRDAIAPLVGEHCQFVPATFTNAAVSNEYFAINPLALIDCCLDLESSEYTPNHVGKPSSVDRAVLDQSYLEERLEPTQRQIFQSRYPMMMLCSDDVKDAIDAIEPTGLKLFPVNEWNSNVVFQMIKEERRKKRGR